VHHVGVIKEPMDVLGAQFSMSFSMAMDLYGHGNGWWDYVNVKLDDSELLALSEKISVVLEDSDDSNFVTGLQVEVDTSSGETLQATVEHARGEPERPMTDAELRSKFDSLSKPVIGDRSDEIAELVTGLRGVADVSRLGATLRA